MECGQTPQRLIDIIASALVKDAGGNVSLNLGLLQQECETLEPFIDCDNNHIPAESLIQLISGEDDCGLPNLKVALSSLIDLMVTWAGTLSGQLLMLLEVDFHYQIDTLGSGNRTSK